MRRHFIIIGIFLGGLVGQYAWADIIVKTCLDYTPYTENERGKKVWHGRNIETLYVVSKKLGVQLDMSMRAPFARCLRLLEQGRIDIVAGLIYTQRRDQQFLLIPYSFKTRLAIFYPKSRPEPLQPDSLSKQDAIGMQLAFALPDNLKNSALMAHIAPIPSVSTGLHMALRNRLAGVLSGVKNGQQIISEIEEYRDKFDFVVLDNSGNKSVHFGIHPDSPLAAREEDILSIVAEMADDPNYGHLGL